MKYGMNLLLWTGGVTEQHFGLLADIKRWGFDGVELPLFDAEESLLKHTRRELESLGLESTAVCICTPETNPIDESPFLARTLYASTRTRSWSARQA